VKLLVDQAGGIPDNALSQAEFMTGAKSREDKNDLQ
jgi:hypothetical protein